MGSEEEKEADSNRAIPSDNDFYLHPSLFELDRPRGILSQTDREYVVGEQEYEHQQSELNRKQEIRKRTKNSFRDFRLLNYLDGDQREKIFEELDEQEIEEALTSFIAFAYKGIDQDTEWLEEILRTGISYGITTDKKGAWAADIKSISVDIDIEYEPDVDEVYERFKQGEDELLLPEEIGLLVRNGKLSPEDLERLDRSDPMELPAKLERIQKGAVEMFEDMEGVEVMDEDPRGGDNSEPE